MSNPSVIALDHSVLSIVYPNPEAPRRVVEIGGLEPPTSALRTQRLSQLSYIPTAGAPGPIGARLVYHMRGVREGGREPEFSP